MITTPLMEQQLPVDLPKATTSLPTTMPDPKSILTLTLSKDGSVLLGSDKVTLDQLTPLLTQRKARDPELVVSLRADSSLPYEKIFRALEAVRSAGARLDLANTPTSASEPPRTPFSAYRSDRIRCSPCPLTALRPSAYSVP